MYRELNYALLPSLGLHATMHAWSRIARRLAWSWFATLTVRPQPNFDPP
jgi:hypothetical protein